MTGLTKALSSAALAVVLAGCAAPTPIPTVVCPAIVEYTPDFQRRVASDLAAYVPPGSSIERLVLDYVALRDQVRACEKSSR